VTALKNGRKKNTVKHSFRMNFNITGGSRQGKKTAEQEVFALIISLGKLIVIHQLEKNELLLQNGLAYRLACL
jgi:hypothetical protein